jgi:hypothetical protein
METRRATWATDTPGASISRQIERFSSAFQRRYLRRRGIDPGNGVDTPAHLPGHDRRRSPISKGGETRRSQKTKDPGPYRYDA